MAFETAPTTQTPTPPIHTTGKMKAKKIDLTTSPQTIAVPSWVRYIIVVNDGVNDAGMTFFSDAPAQFFPVKVDWQPLRIDVNKDVVINVAALSGTTTLRCILGG